MRLKNTVSRPLTARSPAAGKPSFVHGDLPYTLGQRVQHELFGEGTVLQFEGQGNGLRVQVNFEEAGSKWLVVSFAKLQPL